MSAEAKRIRRATTADSSHIAALIAHELLEAVADKPVNLHAQVLHEIGVPAVPEFPKTFYRRGGANR
jgi:hypothetical protein